jgi:putative ABC transport system ATP-binding protein
MQVMESNGAILSLEDVALTLASAAGAVNILRGVDLEVAPSETLGVVGPSGSGKSTLMSVIAGLERPTSGSVSVAGRQLGELSEDELALFRRQHVGIVFQSFHLIPTMTAIENVAIPLELAGRRDAFTAAGAMLERVGLEARLGHYPSQLSGGEQQRVALARAFAGGPDLVLADEPTGNLDSETGAAIVELMFDIQDRDGSTLLLITHDDAVAERCKRIVQMNDGRLHDAPTGRP